MTTMTIPGWNISGTLLDFTGTNATLATIQSALSAASTGSQLIVTNATMASMTGIQISAGDFASIASGSFSKITFADLWTQDLADKEMVFTA